MVHQSKFTSISCLHMHAHAHIRWSHTESPTWSCQYSCKGDLGPNHNLILPAIYGSSIWLLVHEYSIIMLLHATCTSYIVFLPLTVGHGIENGHVAVLAFPCSEGGPSSSDHLPKHNTKAENITRLSVVPTYEGWCEHECVSVCVWVCVWVWMLMNVCVCKSVHLFVQE